MAWTISSAIIYCEFLKTNRMRAGGNIPALGRGFEMNQKQINIDAIECLRCGSTNSTNPKPVFEAFGEIPGGGYPVNIRLRWTCGDCGRSSSVAIAVLDDLYHNGYEDGE